LTVGEYKAVPAGGISAGSTTKNIRRCTMVQRRLSLFLCFSFFMEDGLAAITFRLRARQGHAVVEPFFVCYPSLLFCFFRFFPAFSYSFLCFIFDFVSGILFLLIIYFSFIFLCISSAPRPLFYIYIYFIVIFILLYFIAARFFFIFIVFSHFSCFSPFRLFCFYYICISAEDRPVFTQKQKRAAV